MNKGNDLKGSGDSVIDELLGDQFNAETLAEDPTLVPYGKNERETAKITILTTATHVILEFNKPARWLNLPPDLAIDIGNQLRKWGRKLAKKMYKT